MFNRKSLLTGEIIHYYSNDPAFDKELRRTDVDPPADAPEDWKPPPVFDHKLWIETQDMKFLPTRPTAKPVQFVLARPTPSERAFIEDMVLDRGNVQGSMWALRIAFRGCRPQPPGTPEFKRIVEEHQSVITEEWTELLLTHDGGALWAELLARYVREVNTASR